MFCVEDVEQIKRLAEMLGSNYASLIAKFEKQAGLFFTLIDDVIAFPDDEHFELLTTDAHKLKGSALSLYCHSFAGVIQNIGHSASDRDTQFIEQSAQSAKTIYAESLKVLLDQAKIAG